MSVQYVPLAEDEREAFQSMITDMYLHGLCYEFAAALQRLTWWPMVGLRTAEYPICHAGVRDPEGRIWDVRGSNPKTAFRQPFGAGEIRDVTLDDLREVRPVTEFAIETAMCHAEIVWPDLPRKGTSRLERTRAFLGELDQLCRKHGLWIRSPWPAPNNWPVIAQGEGDESIVFRPTVDGNAYIFDRAIDPKAD